MENQEIKLLKTNIADQEAILIKLKEKLFEKTQNLTTEQETETETETNTDPDPEPDDNANTTALKKGLEEAIKEIDRIVNGSGFYSNRENSGLDLIIKKLDIFDNAINTLNSVTGNVNITNMTTAINEIKKIILNPDEIPRKDFIKIREILKALDTKTLENIDKINQKYSKNSNYLNPTLLLTMEEITTARENQKTKLETYADEIIKLKSNKYLDVNLVNKKIDSILLNIFQILGNINISVLPVSQEYLLKLFKVSLFALQTVGIYTDSHRQIGTKLEIEDDAKKMIENIPFSKLNLRKKFLDLNGLSDFNAAVRHIASREYFLEEDDLCMEIDSKSCLGKLTILNIIKTMEFIYKTSELCWYFKLFPDFIKSMKTPPKNGWTATQKMRLKVFDYILRKNLCSTTSTSDKTKWPVPDGYFTPLIKAIENANIIQDEDLPKINISGFIKLRKEKSGAWFGGKTKRRTKRTRGRKTKRRTRGRKLRKR